MRTPLHAALQLRVKIARALAAREQKARKRNLTKYIPNAAQAIFTVRSWPYTMLDAQDVDLFGHLSRCGTIMSTNE